MSNFSADVSKFVEQAKGNTEAVVRKILFDIGRRLVERSPVGDRERWIVNIDRASRGLTPVPKGYVGGRFRGNWQYGFGTPPQGTKDLIDPSGAVSMAAITTGVLGNPYAGVHYFVNNLPYAQRLEDGWSSQAVAPDAIVGRTVQEFRNFVREANR